MDGPAEIVGFRCGGGRDVRFVVDQGEVGEDERPGGDVLFEESGGEPPVGRIVDESAGAVGADLGDPFVPCLRSSELIAGRAGDESGQRFGMIERKRQTDGARDRDAAVGEGVHADRGQRLDEAGGQVCDRVRFGLIAERFVCRQGVSGQVGDVDLEIIGQSAGDRRPQRHPRAQRVAEDEDGRTGIVVEGTDSDAHLRLLGVREGSTGFRRPCGQESSVVSLPPENSR